MRSEILSKIQTLLENEDLESIRQEVRTAVDEFRTLTQESVRKQKELWAAEEHEPDATFEYEPIAEESVFDQVITVFKAREKEWRKQIAEKQRENLKAKKGMLERLRQTIQEEENIGAAFAVFNEVREAWDLVGDIPGDQYKIIHDGYYRLRDEFFYNINIYKELKENDLKVNHKKKETLLELAKALPEISQLADREKQARLLQKQWLDVGPSPRENYQALSDAFFGMVRPVFADVKAHYDELRASFQANAEAKEKTIEQLRAVVAEEVAAEHEAWQAATAQVVALQVDWKALGFAGKEVNEALWKAFRELADVFFKKKQLFYDAQKEVGKENKAQKMALLEKAEGLVSSTDWKETAQVMKQLQLDWKNSGQCSPSEEQRLWRRFRKAQDRFFKARNAQFAERDATEKSNLQAKNVLLKNIESFQVSGDRKTDLDVLKALSIEWNAIGFVPRNSLDGLMNRYRELMDAHYDSLSAQRSERAMETYKQRVESLMSGDANSVHREQSILREKMNRLTMRVSKTEENLHRFTGSGAEAIRSQYEKTMAEDQREMEEIREKLKLLRQSLSPPAEEPKSE